MAGDWFKVEVVTPDKPEIFLMAEGLQIDPDAVLGKLIRIWAWADQHTEDGNAARVTKALLDRQAGVTGFAVEMEKVGWLVQTDDGMTFPNFDRHNGQTSKRRALNAKRQSSYRTKSNADSNANSNAASVTSASPREEKRREEVNNNNNSGASSRFKKPSVEEVAEYCRERNSGIDAEHFWNYYESKGWKVGKAPMKNWKSAILTWERNEGKGNRGSPKTGFNQDDEIRKFEEQFGNGR